MNRRTFFKVLSGGLAASAAIPLLPISAPPLQSLAFHPAAFSLVMKDFDVAKASSMDVLFGWGALKAPMAARFADERGSFLNYIEHERLAMI